MDEQLICNWKLVTECLFDSDKFLESCQKKQLENAVQGLCKVQMDSVVSDGFIQTLQQSITSKLAPAFWKHFSEIIPQTEYIPHLSLAFDELHLQVGKYLECIERLGIIQSYSEIDITDESVFTKKKNVCAKKQMLLTLKAVVFYKANKVFLDSLNHLYTQAFKSFDTSTKLNDTDEVECLTCDGCEKEKEECQCSIILQSFRDINTKLRELELLECVSSEAVTLLIHQRIKQHIEHTCQGNFEVQYLPILQEWLDTLVVGWLELWYGENDKDQSASTCIQAHKGRLYHYMYEVFAKVAICQLFDVIIEYPESEPALLDLKVCLEKINLRNELVTSLRTALETRLLHPGVNTQDILTAYISAIRSLRVLDPAGVLLDLVCEPVRSYLRNREDTVRCIVTSLTEEGNTELSDELIKAQPLVLDESYHSDEEGDNWETWQPDPVDADPLKSSSRRSSDIISMLVNIYGSKELFVTEYQTLLADRILTHFNYDTQKEIRYLELLKLRFGESQLHLCEVMLKDVADSKRLNTNILEKKEKEKKDKESETTEETEKQETPTEEINVSGMILSAQFWPTFREEKLQIPDCMQEALDKYTKSFEALKGNRTLVWRPHLGLVDIELELKDRILNLKVSPIHATIIWHFQEKNKWSIDELSSIMHMPAHALRRKIAFWQSHGLLKEESADTFLLLEEQRGRHPHDSTMVIEEEETESAMASAQDMKEEEYQVIWQYIMGMLTNLESLPLERIHSMLKMFAMQGPGSDCTVHELKAFLDKKVKEQKLIFTAGIYRLVKST